MFPNCVCSLHENTKILISKVKAMFVNTLLEQHEHHRSDTALSPLRAVMCCALLSPFSIWVKLIVHWLSSPLRYQLRLQIIQSKYLRVIGNHPRRTHISHLHNPLNIEPIPVLIHRLTDKFYAHRPLTPQPSSPTNRELYSSRHEWLVQKMQTYS